MQKEKYIPQLTGIRAVAAYMVYLHNIPLAPVLLPVTLGAMLKELHIGVTLFFVLSGFLIYRNYANSVQLNREWWSTYVNNRIARLYPLYFLVSCVTLFAQFYQDSLSWFLNLTFLRGFSDPYKYSAVAQGWSLTPEWCFYIAAPLLFVGFRRQGFFRLLVLTYSVGGLLMLIGDNVDLYHFFRGFHFMFGYTFFGRCFEFFSGMYLAAYLEKKKPAQRTGFPFITVASIFGLVLAIYAMSRFQSQEITFGVDHWGGRLLNNYGMPLLFSALFYGLILERSIFRRALSSRPMVLLGKASYSFYLIHMGILQGMINAWIPFKNYTHYLVVFVLLNLCALFLYFAFEMPMNNWMRRRLITRAENLRMKSTAGASLSSDQPLAVP